MAIFKTGGNFKSNTGHFYINFEYKTYLNFGGNFSKKKVHLIVHKIRYIQAFIQDRKGNIRNKMSQAVRQTADNAKEFL